MSSAIPHWLSAITKTHRDELASLGPDEAALLQRAITALRHDAYRLLDLPGASVLTGLLSLRLHVQHEMLNPLVSTQSAASSAATLLDVLLGWEQAARSALGPEQRGASLRYDTFAALHPPPPRWLLSCGRSGEAGRANEHHVGEAAGDPLDTTDVTREERSSPGRHGLSPSSLDALTERWEATHASESLGSYLRRKLGQNADFFRHFALLPVYWWRRRRIRRQLSERLRAHPVVRETYFAIEQVGPVVDGFVFRGRGRSSAVHAGLADFVFLYMQMADELVDSLVHHLGEAGVRTLVEARYARSLRASQLIPFENLDADALSAAGLSPATPIPKYETDFAGMLDLLTDLRVVIEEGIEAAEADGLAVGADVQGFFHHCFATYLDELELGRAMPEGKTPDQIPLADAQWHFYRKNNLVMMRWMALRARLLGLAPEHHVAAIQRWGNVLATFQVFDDMKDVLSDFGFQPNIMLQAAATYFPREHAWLDSNLPREDRGLRTDEVLWLDLNVPRTVMHCLRLSRLIALSCFDYAAMYAWDYRWRKNWMSGHRSFNASSDADALLAVGGAQRSGVRIVDSIFAVLRQTRELAEEMQSDDEYLAYVMDIAAYDNGAQSYLAALPSPRRFYRFATLRMWLPASEKAELLRRVLRRHARKAAPAFRHVAAELITSGHPAAVARLRPLFGGDKLALPEGAPDSAVD